jgi:3-isopropylmalate dehydratase small subunit
MTSGSYFRQSSWRAKAAKALQLVGGGWIVAYSFVRSVLRNAYEVGLPIIGYPGARSVGKDQDHSGVDLIGGVKIITTGVERRYRSIGDSRLIN